MRRAGIIFQQYAKSFVATPCEIADLYDNGNENDVFIEGVDVSVRHKLRYY